MIERSYLLAGVKGEQPVVKGRLYGNVDVTNSAWQLEPRTSRPNSTRECTTSTLSITSTQSSYAFISDLEISSSFAVSLESAQTSEVEEPVISFPASLFANIICRRTAWISSVDGHSCIWTRVTRHAAPRPVIVLLARVIAFAFRKIVKFASGEGSVCHLAIPYSGSRTSGTFPSAPIPMLYEPDVEVKYNMDPTNLVLFAIELLDIRKDREEAFECFMYVFFFLDTSHVG
ncbi:hypothetical protein EDC04DRAFT_3136611 [Pisolithus marmoratus]|nr:hypothetical protein EDC04DRAFT_3136611 [Pisolithus marmoratus]